MEFAQRLKSLQKNVFADMDRAKAQARSAGKEIIDLSLGSSDLPAPKVAIEAMTVALQDPNTHGYALFHSTQSFREAIAWTYTQKYGISIDPETEVLPLIGSQEGTAHLPLAVLNPGDIALLLDPGYPSHAGGVNLAGGEIYTLPLRPENHFLPIFNDIPPEVRNQARLMVLSYPHNPTTAIASLSFFEEAVAFCCRYNIILAHDFPYSDFVFSDTPAPSILQAENAKHCAIEFFTFSKSYNMGGFRIGYAVGNRELIAALRQIKAVIDFNQYRGIMQGAIAALTEPTIPRETLAIYEKRRDLFVKALQDLGWSLSVPPATPYIWAKLPEPWQKQSVKFCIDLVKTTGVALSPGAGFGKNGEGYVRFALVCESDRLQMALARLGEFLKSA